MSYLGNIKLMNETSHKVASRNNQEVLFSFPEKITVTTTFKCNYRCSMCYQKDFTQEIDWAAVEKLIPVLPFARELQIFGGEPLLYPRIHDLYKLAHMNGNRITMISNGSLLSPKMVDDIVSNHVYHIKFSLDAGTPETYKKIRGGNFFKVLEGVARITQRKLELGIQHPIMHFNFLAMRSNVHELSRLAILASEVGVQMINVFYPTCNTEALLDECLYFDPIYGDTHLAKALEIGKQLGVVINIPPLLTDTTNVQAHETSHIKFCEDPWNTMLVDPDGKAKLCCGGPTVIGNLHEQSFDEIWNSDKAQAFRRTVNTDKEPSFCRTCKVRKQTPRDLGHHISSPELQALAKQRLETLRAQGKAVPVSVA